MKTAATAALAAIVLTAGLHAQTTQTLTIRGREQTLHIAWPKEGIDLRVQLGWPNNASLSAARIVVTAPDGAEYQRSVWGKGPVDEVVSFP